MMITGLATTLPHTMATGLHAQGIPQATADSVAALPPVSTLFAAFLGNNPIGHLLAGNGVTLSSGQAAVLTGNTFFPELVSGPFHQGLVTVFSAATAMAVIAAVASLLRGRPTS